MRPHRYHEILHKDYCQIVPVGEYCNRCHHPLGRYYTAATNGLNPEHYDTGDRVWCNPPYDASLIKWLALASETRQRGVFWELLLPPSIDTKWWHQYVWDKRLHRPREGVEVEFLDYRIAFIDPDRPEAASPRAGNVLVRFWPDEAQAPNTRKEKR